MSAPLLEVEGLSTHFLVQRRIFKVVDDVSFRISKGEVFGILGESGCGKSMMGYSIMNLVDHPGRILSGRIAFDGRDTRAFSAEAWRQVRGNRMTMIFQDPMMALSPGLRIDVQMIETILAHRQVSPAAARERARAALFRAGFALPDACMASYPDQLSAGTCQRLAIAMALLNDPELIIADDPGAGCDPIVQGQIMYAMQTCIRETGAGVLWMTRDVISIAAIADRIGVMYAGRIVEEGAVADVLGDPAHPYTQALLDSVPSRTKRGGRFKALQGIAPSPAELPSGCAFRARCERAMDACVGAPSMRMIGDLARGQALRCHNPIPQVSVRG